MQQQAFLDAIVAAPEDDAPRLVYADWLEENGDSDRAEFIRLQCDLARRARFDIARRPLLDRERQLLQLHGAEWAKPVASLVRDYHFRRGFVEGVSIGVRKFLTDGEELFAAAPIQHVKFLRLGPAKATASDLAKSPYLPRIRSMMLSGQLPPDELSTLIKSPGLKGLTALTVDQTVATDDVDLLVAGRLPRLQSLRLGTEAPVVTTPHVEALAKARWAGGLTNLDLSYQPVNVPGAQAIASSKRFRKLARLRLFDCGVGLAGTRALADSTNLPALVILDLRSNRLTASAALAVASAKGFPALTELYLGMNRIGPEGARALAGWHGLARLRLLHLYSNPIGDDGAIALAESPHIANLVYLDVTQTGITDRGLKALAESPYLRSAKVGSLFQWPKDEEW